MRFLLRPVCWLRGHEMFGWVLGRNAFGTCLRCGGRWVREDVYVDRSPLTRR